MKKQKNIFLVIMLALLSWSGLSAQATKINFEGKYKDIVIPSKTKAEYLVLEAVGGDGGKIERNNQWGGGKGAFVSAYFKMGSANTQIQAGGTLRFMVGGKGDSRTDMDNANYTGVGGGGGTGIAYKAPGEDNWKLLMVAGGGGGAYWKWGGGESGGSGKAYASDNIGDGGATTNIKTVVSMGSAGDTKASEYSDSDGSGAGAYGSSDINDKDKRANAGWADGPNGGEPTGGSGHDGSHAKYYSGGWGFGAGGIGRRGFPNFLPAGGGGYSGGAPGVSGDWRSEGGTSYVNEDMEVSRITTSTRGTTTSPSNGYASYELTYEPVYISAAADLDMVLYKSGHETTVDDGTSLVLGERVYNDFFVGNMLWIMDKATHEIKMAYNTGKCIDLQHQNTTNGTKVQLFHCNHTAAQQWLFDKNSGLIKYKANTNKCLIMTSYDSPLKIWDCNSSAISDDQKKWVTHAVDAPIYINMKSTLKQNTIYTIAKPGDINKVDNGIILKRAEKNYQGSYYKANQIWKFLPANNTFQYARDDSKCIDLQARNTSNGTPIQLYRCHGGEAQQWTMYNYMIKYKANMDKCIVWNNGLTSKVNDSQLVIWDCNDARVTDEQKLWFYTFEDE